MVAPSRCGNPGAACCTTGGNNSRCTLVGTVGGPEGAGSWVTLCEGLRGSGGLPRKSFPATTDERGAADSAGSGGDAVSRDSVGAISLPSDGESAPLCTCRGET